MAKFVVRFNYSILYFKRPKVDEKVLKNCLKDYSEFFSFECDFEGSLKFFEVKIRLHDKKSADLKKITTEFYDYVLSFT